MLIGLGSTAIVLLLAAGYVGYRTFLAPPPPPPVVKHPVVKPVTPPAAKPAPAPTAAATPEVAHIPAKAIEKAATVAGAQATSAEATNAVVASESAAPAAPETKPPTPKPAAVEETSAVTELAPGVSTTSQIDAAPEASAAFRTFVANLKISGFVAGREPRALINGRLVHVGDALNSDLGITFDGVKGGQLVFKDRTGATVLRRY